MNIYTHTTRNGHKIEESENHVGQTRCVHTKPAMEVNARACFHVPASIVPAYRVNITPITVNLLVSGQFAQKCLELNQYKQGFSW